MKNKLLAYKLRPESLDEVIGQEHLIGKNKILNRMVETGAMQSIILYGPPGIGKTSIASAVAGSLNVPFRELNASISNKKDLEIIVEESKISGSIVLLLDEIHRLDRTKQDYLLSFLEKGSIILIGATTENPYLSVTPAIRSRTKIFELKPLTEENIFAGLKKSLKNKKSGFGEVNISISDKLLRQIALSSAGDYRSALNNLELLVRSAKEKNGKIKITEDDVSEVTNFRPISMDKNGDGHFNTISALQKSIRGSDTDAALHYLSRILESGDLSIATRRLMVIAYEDIGLANPPAVSRAIQAIETATKIGLPEARIPLANAVIELSLSPKSNSAYEAINKAMDDIKNKNIGEVPKHLQNSRNWGKSKDEQIDYLYPHNFENDWVKQQYLPDELKNVEYFNPKGNSSYEENIKKTYKTLKKNQK